jgi:predicted small metal-binding protein
MVLRTAAPGERFPGAKLFPNSRQGRDNISPASFLSDGRPAGGAMSKVIKCPCGTVVRARDEDSLVTQAQKHAREVHAMDLSREQVLAMASPE